MLSFDDVKKFFLIFRRQIFPKTNILNMKKQSHIKSINNLHIQKNKNEVDLASFKDINHSRNNIKIIQNFKTSKSKINFKYNNNSNNTNNNVINNNMKSSNIDIDLNPILIIRIIFFLSLVENKKQIDLNDNQLQVEVEFDDDISNIKSIGLDNNLITEVFFNKALEVCMIYYNIYCRFLYYNFILVIILLLNDFL